MSRWCEDCGAEEGNSAFIICWSCAGDLVDEKPIKTLNEIRRETHRTWWQKIMEWFTK